MNRKDIGLESAEKTSKHFLYIEEKSPTRMIIGGRKGNLAIAIALPIIILIVVILAFFPLYDKAPNFLILVLYFATFLPLIIVPNIWVWRQAYRMARSITLDKDSGKMSIESPLSFLKRRHEYPLDQIEEIRCRYISEGLRANLSIVMKDGENITLYKEERLLRKLGMGASMLLQMSKHYAPLKIARFLQVPYRKIFWSSDSQEDISKNSEVINPEDMSEKA